MNYEEKTTLIQKDQSDHDLLINLSLDKSGICNAIEN